MAVARVEVLPVLSRGRDLLIEHIAVPDDIRSMPTGPAHLEASAGGPAERAESTTVAVLKPAAAAGRSSLGAAQWALAAGVALVVAGGAYVLAYYVLLPDCFRAAGGCTASDVYQVSSDVSLFAGFFVLALAVERFLSLFNRWFVPGAAANRDARDQADADGDVVALAERQGKVDRDRQVGSIIHWGVAAALSFLMAAQLNILLLTSIGGAGSARPNAALDLLVTGLVIGAGTKPLHDLVARIEKSKEVAQDPTSTGGTR